MNAKSSNSKLQLFRVITHLVIDISPKYNLHGRLLTRSQKFSGYKQMVIPPEHDMQL